MRNEANITSLRASDSIRFKYTLGLVLFAILLSVSASTVGYLEFQSSLERQYTERAYTIGRMLSSQLDGDNIELYLMDAVYQPAPISTGSLRSLWENMDIHYIFLMSADTSRVRYIYIREGESSASANIRTDLATISNLKEERYLSSRIGRTIVVDVPVFDSNDNATGFVRTGIGLDDMQWGLRRYLAESLFLTLIIAIIITMWYLSIIRTNFVKPIELVTQKTLEFSRSKYQVLPEITSPKTHDEIDNLTCAISKMTKDMKEYIDNIESNIIEKQRMTAELLVAKQIQNLLMPEHSLSNGEIDLYALMDPAQEVGGDFYDYFYTLPNEVAIVIGDVSGKGIPAALFMSNTKETIKNRSTDMIPPSRIFEIANQKLAQSSSDRMFVSSWMGKLNLETGDLTYVSAGHPPAMLSRKGGSFFPISYHQNMLLALFEDSTYSQTTIRLQEGDVVFVYTDGVTEATRSDEQFGEDKLVEALDRHLQNHFEMKDFVHALRDEIEVYEQEKGQKDDITMLAFRYKGQSRSRIDHIL